VGRGCNFLNQLDWNRYIYQGVRVRRCEGELRRSETTKVRTTKVRDCETANMGGHKGGRPRGHKGARPRRCETARPRRCATARLRIWEATKERDREGARLNQLDWMIELPRSETAKVRGHEGARLRDHEGAKVRCENGENGENAKVRQITMAKKILVIVW
jgi:hypothetical protein